MTNEWGPPLPGDEMKALEGRIDPGTPVCLLDPWEEKEVYSFWNYDSNGYHLPANHPYYKVREYNAKHGTNLVLHDGSAKVPEDWDGGDVWFFWASEPRDSGALFTWDGVIAYTPKPKESEMPSDEAIEYVLRQGAFIKPGLALVRERAPNGEYKNIIDHARLIQQYEPVRLKPAVDVAAEEYVNSIGVLVGFSDDKNELALKCFKAGAAWQKENGNG